MSATVMTTEIPNWSIGTSIQRDIEVAIEDLMLSLPDPAQLSASQRRGIIARYTAVLEGNFIYWMTAAYLSVRSAASHAIILDNLLEEVRDSHPHMLRKFAIAAEAVPTDLDAMAVYPELTSVRLFVGRLSAAPTVATMAFFEGFIQRFMAFLADLAQRQGSTEMEYTDVHGVCDVAHTEGLFRALEAEMSSDKPESNAALFEGVGLLRVLIQKIVHPVAVHHS